MIVFVNMFKKKVMHIIIRFMNKSSEFAFSCFPFSVNCRNSTLLEDNIDPLTCKIMYYSFVFGC
jgi:hypothetical protein